MLITNTEHPKLTLINYTFELSTERIALGSFAGLGLLALLLPLSRRNRMWMMLGMLLLGIGFVACSKQSKDMTYAESEQLYIRILQVDKDGKKTYSKIVTAVSQ